VKLSVVMPARNEASSIEPTLRGLAAELEAAGIEHELLVIDDASTDGTADVAARIAEELPTVRCVRSHYPNGYGFAVRAGLDLFEGDGVAIVMADGSDSPADVVRYHGVLEAGFDCAFGSRFLPTSTVTDYPRLKLMLNRVVNWGIKVLFRHGYNDTTNAFKAYRREVIENVQPLLSNHFNLTVELPLKAVVRGHSFAVLPISWSNRRAGESKLGLREMGSRYLFIVLYAFLEAHLTRGAYLRPGAERRRRARPPLRRRIPGRDRRGRRHSPVDGAAGAPERSRSR
jgi:dolichol-phosphate mannosyltransferase